MIHLHRPKLQKKTIKECSEVLTTNWISTGGKYIQKFENDIKRIVGTKYAVSFTNCTSALQISLKLSGADKNTDVLVPSTSFIATANSILYNNSNPFFLDVSKDLNINVDKAIQFLDNKTYKKKNFTYNKITKRKISCLLIVHVFGSPISRIEKLKKKCVEKNIFLIEDCAESLGSYHLKKNKRLHTGYYGDISCFSFNGNKIVTAGSGGMLCTNNKNINDKAKYLSTTAKDIAYDFTHNNLGYNFRLSNINACIGHYEIKKLNQIIKKKNFIFNLYKKEFENEKKIEIIYPDIQNVKSNHWLNVIRIKSKFNLNKKFMIFSKKNSIETRAVWKLLYLQKHLKKFNSSQCINSKNYIRNCFCIPSGLELNKNDIKKISKKIRSFLKGIR